MHFWHYATIICDLLSVRFWGLKMNFRKKAVFLKTEGECELKQFLHDYCLAYTNHQVSIFDLSPYDFFFKFKEFLYPKTNFRVKSNFSLMENLFHFILFYFNNHDYCFFNEFAHLIKEIRYQENGKDYANCLKKVIVLNNGYVVWFYSYIYLKQNLKKENDISVCFEIRCFKNESYSQIIFDDFQNFSLNVNPYNLNKKDLNKWFEIKSRQADFDFDDWIKKIFTYFNKVNKMLLLKLTEKVTYEN